MPDRWRIFSTEKFKEEFGHRKTEEKQCIAIAASTVPAQYLLPELLAKI